ncbi:hypothetical protein [Lacipirellula parvula]|uniref:PEP-CTERM protein-sorting domain-containing protein n=1 Tax=Lacipirellula parvula TaxID=2650471 RepID=A0A5K7X8A5_9BACT|nr:hypothetical protein [Lacipirellula parvula]BBO32860.1 hypothetical protein PLANPX_2472 [Lacipirellula parvula]
MRRRLMIAPLLVSSLVLAPRTTMGANYDESVLTDLSGTPTLPTTIVLDSRSNLVVGSAGAGDFDLIHFSVPVGSSLTSLTLASYVNPFNAVSFVGLGAGTTWTAGLDFDVDPSKLLGWSHIAAEGSSGVGADLLIDMSVAPFTPGFARPLAAGDYTLLIQDTDNVVNYSLDLVLAGPSIAGDFNSDGKVDGLDLEQWRGDFGVNQDSDADNDGDTDGADFLIWQRAFGSSAPVSAVPEPAALTSAIIAAVSASRFRGRRRNCL